MSRHRLPAFLLSTATVAALAIPVAGAGAGAKPRERDHDRMPDRWERVHGLKIARDDARRDRDRDGLRNLAEYKAGLDPRDPDTDDDGVRDGAEDAGTVVSFSGGVLVIKTFDGETLQGRVTDRTEVECDDDDKPAQLRSRGDGDPGGDDAEDHPDRGDRDDAEDHPERGDRDDDERGEEPDRNADERRENDDAPATGTAVATDPVGPSVPREQEHADEHRGDEDDDPREHDEQDDCGPAALVAGARVDEAKLSVTRKGRVWSQVQLGN